MPQENLLDLWLKLVPREDLSLPYLYLVGVEGYCSNSPDVEKRTYQKSLASGLGAFRMEGELLKVRERFGDMEGSDVTPSSHPWLELQAEFAIPVGVASLEDSPDPDEPDSQTPERHAEGEVGTDELHAMFCPVAKVREHRLLLVLVGVAIRSGTSSDGPGLFRQSPQPGFDCEIIIS